MRLPTPHHLKTPHHLPAPPVVLVQTFWILVVFTLAMAVSLVTFARVNPIDAPIVGIGILVLGVLWCLHVIAAHRHREDIRNDMAFRRARERRGF